MHLRFFYGSENKQRLFVFTTLTYRFLYRVKECLLRGTDLVFKIDGRVSSLKVNMHYVIILSQVVPSYVLQNRTELFDKGSISLKFLLVYSTGLDFPSSRTVLGCFHNLDVHGRRATVQNM